ncbi:MAG: hypothetical protein CVT49_00770 [candidate division Zixibacteria bacterium HGW-Zixibacteria-1]|nr:MAG: hypothetical protein CVT49_00770 [candidate division Zixibacteria bacterium HGW-Zixibacteria-1]
MFWSFFLCVFLTSALVYAYTSSYSVDVTKSKGEYLEEDGNVGYAWKNLDISVKKNTISLSFDLKVWNNKRTPITQLYVCINNKVYDCVFNRVRRKSAVEKYQDVSVSFTVNYPSENATHKIYLVQTQAMGVDAGQNHVEVEGGGWKSKIGTLSTH